MVNMDAPRSEAPNGSPVDHAMLCTPGRGLISRSICFEELQQGRVGRIARPQRIDHHRQDPIRAIAAVDMVDGHERAQQQSGAEQQDAPPSRSLLPTSRLRNLPPRPVTVRLSDAIACADENSLACHAGARPNSRPTSSAAAAQNATTRTSKVSVTAAGSSPSRNQRRRDGQNRRADARRPGRRRSARARGSRSGAAG